MSRKYITALVGAAVALSLVAIPALAQTSGNPIPSNTSPNGPANSQFHGKGARPGMGMWGNASSTRGMMMRPSVMGTVTAVNAATLTVAGHSFALGPNGQNGQQATTTFTVNASGATVYKDNATSTLSAVAVNDRVFIQGAISGTAVTATVIRDGLGFGQKGPMMNGQVPGGALSHMTGNGQPVVAGTVSNVSGTSFTITTASNTSYNIDASSASITKAGSSGTPTSIATGDYVVVQGTVNGTAVTAASVIDQQPAPTTGSDTSHQGVLGAIGNFFRHIFGF